MSFQRVSFYLIFFLAKMERNIFETLSEAIDEFESPAFRDDQDIVLPPSSNDDDIGPAGNLTLPADVSGAVEIHHRYNNGNNEV